MLAACLVIPSSVFAQQPAPSLRPITIDDYFQIRAVADPQLSPDGRYVAYSVKTALLKDDKNESRIWMVSTSRGDAIPLSAEGVSSSHPRWSPDGKLTQLTHANDALFSQLKLSQTEYVRFKSKDAAIVSGYLYKPVDYVPGKKYPTILRPHGGPVWAYYAEFAHLPQLLAANGYAILFPNPRGSSGYGEDFCKAIFADWGNKDYQDDMAMVDYAIARGIADPDRLGVGGWSYGGISTDFIIAQTTRFRAAISGAGEALNTSFYGHDHYQRDYITELGRPWEDHALWDKLSPFYRIDKITTPTLFMGGEVDWNVPVLGGEQMYQALKELGRTTELVVYPGESHEFKTPSHIKDRLERYLAWYAHYVKADGSAARPAEPETAK